MLEIKDSLKAVFITETKNRFLCNVEMFNEVIECYIPNSSRLTNYMNLSGEEVICIRNKGKDLRTKYSVFAVKYNNSYIVLNPSMLNPLVAGEIRNPLLDIYNLNDESQIIRECKVSNYKADISFESNKGSTIIEVKGIISTNKDAMFPTVYSERSLLQLTKIKNLLKEGASIYYVLASLSPTVENIVINSSYTEFANLYSECIRLGMKSRAIRTKFDGKTFSISDRIKVNDKG